eukprot:TRINITY_DN41900_c0_g1_i1.p2 TRINITY_DN41900_c0_g1~~TRINITY_DN41900_c0_g1_i1.p2  ORF type:complete len:256 (-),score=21.50 TRINITY_DN41900_c0_g1_i1:316-1083(-)
MAVCLAAQRAVLPLTFAKLEPAPPASQSASLPSIAPRGSSKRLRSSGVAHGKPIGVEPHVNLNEVSEEEKQRLLDAAARKIERDTRAREESLKAAQQKAHWDHELKFGKMMFEQGNYPTAMSHFDKILKQAGELTYYHGEATLQKAACLEKLGREAEAKSLYESLIQFRAPFPNIKRRAAQALFGGDADGQGGGDKEPSPWDDYMYRMFVGGFGHYAPKTKYVETQQEKVMVQVLPWTILAMAPILLVYLLLRGE